MAYAPLGAMGISNSVAKLLVELFCGIIELLVEMNGQLTERRETEFVEKRCKILY